MRFAHLQGPLLALLERRYIKDAIYTFTGALFVSFAENAATVASLAKRFVSRMTLAPLPSSP